MRVHSLGRWVGRILAITAVGAGAFAGSVATAADQAASDATIAVEATSDAPQGGDSAPNGHEWA